MIRGLLASVSGRKPGRRRTTGPYPISTCHFCNLPSTIVPPHPPGTASIQSQPIISADGEVPSISTGSLESWFCSRCRCWNRVDGREEGGMASWDASMADERSNVGSAQRRGVAPIAATMTAATGSSTPSAGASTLQIFCHACRTNQTLLLSMTANYDGAMDDNGTAYQAWREELERRYPPVCEDCQATVDEHVRRADQRARALIWHELLRRRRQEHSTEAASPSSSTKLPTPTQTHSDERIAATRLSWGWYAGLASMVTGWAAESVLVWSMPRASEAFDLRLVAALAALLLATHYGALRWDPLMGKQVAIARQYGHSERVRVHGREEWRREGVWYVFAFRLAHILGQTFNGHERRSATKSMITIAISLPVQTALLVLAYGNVQVERLARISLKSRMSEGQPRQSSTRKSRRTSDALDFAPLTLGVQRRTQSPIRLSQQKADAANAAEEDDSMDWSPTIPTHEQMGAATTFELGPQRFFAPVQQTGLEELMASRLDLGREAYDRRAGANANAPSVRRQRSGGVKPIRTTFALLMGISAVSIAIGWAALRTPAIVIAAHALLDRLLWPWHDWWRRATSLDEYT